MKISTKLQTPFSEKQSDESSFLRHFYNKLNIILRKEPDKSKMSGNPAKLIGTF